MIPVGAATAGRRGRAEPYQIRHLAEVMYRVFSRQEWAELRTNVPLTISSDELANLRGINEPISLDEITEVYLPLARLLHLDIESLQRLRTAECAFLGGSAHKAPYIIGIGGSVAAGKSTLARILCTLLARWPEPREVALVTTDGFLYPKSVLEERGLMRRKGFPESYDLRRTIQFLAHVKAGKACVTAPVYSHLLYDVVPNEYQIIKRPDILIFEGLSVLQPAGLQSALKHPASVVVSDFLDFSIYLDADEESLRKWYVERFLTLQQTAFQQPISHFHRYKDLTEDEAAATAHQIWSEINLPNLHQNIQPTRERARVVLRKNDDHSIGEVWLRHI